MISYLSVKNIALIRELNVEFKKGLNILSGETGAGKSIIIDSINFVLGDRADRSLIRYGETSAKVEVVFSEIKNYEKIKNILSESDIECDDETVIVSRTMTSDRSECRINRRIVNLSLLRKVVSLLVDTHTQNEHQTLLKIPEHIKILDGFNAQIKPIIINYRELLTGYYKILDNLKQLPSEIERERQIEMLSFQISEIEKTAWTEGEEETLKHKRSLYYNSHNILTALTSAYNALNGDNGLGCTSSASMAISSLKSAAQYDESINELIDRLESVSIEISDIADTLYEKTNNSEISDIDIDKIERRLEDIRLIKKKYGKSYEDVAKFLENAASRLEILKDSETMFAKLSAEKVSIESKLADYAIRLHNMRIETANKFCNEITNNLAELGMKNAVFQIKFDFTPDSIIEHLNQNGAETLEFMLSPNLGEPVKSLAKIASGGEMSRFMLAIKNVIAETDDVDTLIFDEIDTGISGVIAKVVAEKLYDIAKTRQVIAITHLPQLASMGDVNFLIEKMVLNEKTLTFLKELNNEEVYAEIMRLSGAVENSKIGLSNAKELKMQANAYKNCNNK